MASELNNYIEDDWGDNALSGRFSAEKGYYRSLTAGGTGDLLKGVSRPVWDIGLAGPKATNNRLEHDYASNGDGSVRTPSTFTTGKWVMDMAFLTLANNDTYDDSFRMHVLADDTQGTTSDNSVIHIRGGQSGLLHKLMKVDSGSATNLIESTWSGDENWHTSKVVRSAYGQWELFEDGTSQGTATDTYVPANHQFFRIAFGYAGDGNVGAVDNLTVR